jgi:all-trans-retinol 13,14-reductase
VDALPALAMAQGHRCNAAPAPDGRRFLGRQYGDFMSLAHSPNRLALGHLSSHTHIPNLYLSGQDVAAAGVSGALMGGVVAASAALGGDALADLPTAK